MYLGIWHLEDLLTFPVNTSTPSTWAAVDADSNPAWRLYENEVGTALLTGTMAKLDDTNTTGFYTEQITLSAANGFELGKCYTIYIASVVAGVTIVTVHTFQVEENLVGLFDVDFIQIDDNLADLQTVVAAIDTAVGNIEGNVNTIKNDQLPAALVGGRMDSDVRAIDGNTAAADQLGDSAGTIVKGAATATTLTALQMSTNLTEGTDDHYVGRFVIWTSGVLANSFAEITDYNGTTKTLTYTTTKTGESPSNGDTFIVV